MVLTWRTGLASQPWVRFSASPGTDEVHAHDFVEWFWVDAGRMRHEWDGRIQELGVGDVVLLHPGHRHRVSAASSGASHIVLSVEPALFRRITARLRPQVPDWPFPDAHQPPTRRHLSPRALARLRSLVELLPLRDQTPGDAELAVTATLRVLADGNLTADAAPSWLVAAVEALDDPVVAARGVSAFITACGRASAVVCRACRRYHGCRPNQLVERARLDHAARLLRSSAREIPAIAAVCGYASLSHFYRAFARRFAATPAAFRGVEKSAS